MTIGDEFKEAVEFPHYRTNCKLMCLKIIISRPLLLSFVILSTIESSNATHSSKINFK